MQQYDVGGEFQGYFFIKCNGENYKDAVRRLMMKFHDFNVDLSNVKFKLLDGTHIDADFSDWNIEISQELPEGFKEDD